MLGFFNRVRGSLLAAVACGIAATSASAAISTSSNEQFDNTALANNFWGRGDSASSSTYVAPDYVATGGVTGGYIKIDRGFTSTAQAQTVFRGQDNMNSSADAFVGNWIAAGINQVTFSVRQHDTVAHDVYLRIAPINNSPAFAIPVGSLQPTTTDGPWSTYNVPISLAASTSGWTYEGGGGTAESRYNAILGNVANVQVLVLGGGTTLSPNTFAVDFDAISVVPEPATLGLIAVGGFGLLGRRRRGI